MKDRAAPGICRDENFGAWVRGGRTWGHRPATPAAWPEPQKVTSLGVAPAGKDAEFRFDFGKQKLSIAAPLPALKRGSRWLKGRTEVATHVAPTLRWGVWSVYRQSLQNFPRCRRATEAAKTTPVAQTAREHTAGEGAGRSRGAGAWGLRWGGVAGHRPASPAQGRSWSSANTHGAPVSQRQRIS